jgi:hypothetical protein
MYLLSTSNTVNQQSFVYLHRNSLSKIHERIGQHTFLFPCQKSQIRHKSVKSSSVDFVSIFHKTLLHLIFSPEKIILSTFFLLMLVPPSSAASEWLSWRLTFEFQEKRWLNFWTRKPYLTFQESKYTTSALLTDCCLLCPYHYTADRDRSLDLLRYILSGLNAF